MTAGSTCIAGLPPQAPKQRGIAAMVALPEGDFRLKRRAIRDALAATGHAAHMEALVARRCWAG